MANPQLEDGHTKIANEIMDALMRTNFPSHERRILDCILRSTYGWHKKMDRISYSQFAAQTGIDHRNIGRSLTSLKRRGIIICNGHGYSLEYGLQKDYLLWDKNSITVDTNLPSSETPNLPSSHTPIIEDKSVYEMRDLPSSQSDLPSSETPNLPSSHTHTKAIKHIQKHITKAIGGSGGILPDWIDKETWAAYLEMRKAKRATPTARAVELIIKKLDELRNAGQDVKEILNQSIINNWTGIFPLKKQDSSGQKPIKHIEGVTIAND